MLRKSSSLLALAVVVAVPAALFAQDGGSGDDVSRAPDGHILHRRSPEPGDAPVADTPVFVYAPGDSDHAVPKDLVRDGVSLPRPSASTAPADGELIHTAAGLEHATPHDVPPRPLPAPGPGTIDDPASPMAPSPSLVPAESDATITDDDARATGEPVLADGGTTLDDDAPFPSATAPDNADATNGDGGPISDGSDGPDASAVADPREGLGSEARPDRDTRREGTLHYDEVFDPSVVPFKRNRALDVVGDDYVLKVGEGRLETLEPVGNRLERGREVFWGSLLLEGDAGKRIPIPSVSPEGQILSYQANPAQKVVFERDQAGNFYATPELDGRLRLVFVTDAPSHWFGRSLPADARYDQVPRALRPKLPRAIQKEALEVAAQIGIPEGTPFATALGRLVAWFRAFEPGDPLPPEGSVYHDLALGKRGICRHRGHAFVITAQALGIPAHYVFNEAHVFVEVWIPGDDAGWLRIDLGGGADELQVHGAEGKSLHKPLGTDPFDKPPAFADGGAAGATRVEGMPSADDATAEPPTPAADMPDAALDGPIIRARPAPNLEPTRTTINVSDSLVFRGDALHVTGDVATARGAPIAAGTVQILLTTGADDKAVALLGTATIDGGRFAVDVAIPPRQAPGQYEIVAEYVGDGVFAPSVGK